jgi:hypothetical protein
MRSQGSSRTAGGRTTRGPPFTRLARPSRSRGSARSSEDARLPAAHRVHARTGRLGHCRNMRAPRPAALGTPRPSAPTSCFEHARPRTPTSCFGQARSGLPFGTPTCLLPGASTWTLWAPRTPNKPQSPPHLWLVQRGSRAPPRLRNRTSCTARDGSVLGSDGYPPTRGLPAAGRLQKTALLAKWRRTAKVLRTPPEGSPRVFGPASRSVMIKTSRYYY